MNDARRTVRYEIETRVIFSWSDTFGRPRESYGNTRDVSPKGAYVVSACCPPLGTPVKMCFFLPTLTGDPRIVQVQAQGRVLRIDAAGAKSRSGFSVKNERTELCTK
jgi:hypothetical protein